MSADQEAVERKTWVTHSTLVRCQLNLLRSSIYIVVATHTIAAHKHNKNPWLVDLAMVGFFFFTIWWCYFIFRVISCLFVLIWMLTLYFQFRSCFVDQSCVIEFKTWHGTEAGLSRTRLTVIRRLRPQRLSLLLTVPHFTVLILFSLTVILIWLNSHCLLCLFFCLPPLILHCLLLLHLPLMLFFLHPLPLIMWADFAVGVSLPLAQEMASS